MRHRFHAICPYFAMFTELFVRKHLVWSQPNDLIFDPFSGRGTTVFESLLHHRRAAGCDINPVAVCVSNAKADPPTPQEALIRLAEIERLPHSSDNSLEDFPFFAACYHRETLDQILHLRHHLDWRNHRTDRFLAAVALGCLHGESHVSRRYFSNRMPRTISTKPEYSIRWWQKHHYIPPHRNVYDILREVITYRFVSEPAALRGRVTEGDARQAYKMFPEYVGSVSLVITSPPYLDTTNFAEDQWLRLWFLGGPPHPPKTGHRDDRYISAKKYWTFLREAWAGIAPLLKDRAHLVIRIGGKKLDDVSILEGLSDSLHAGLARGLQLVENRTTTIVDSQLRTFRPGVKGVAKEHDFHFILSL